MTTSSLLSGLETATVHGPLPSQITAICHDSREVRDGAAFVAVPGTCTDGHAFLRQALARGAALLVVQADRRPSWANLPVPLVSVPDARTALARLAAGFYGHPARELTVVGITGTDGKTTTSFLAAAVLQAGGLPTALLGTAGSVVGGGYTPNHTHLTTPDPVTVHRFLADARDSGARCAIVEATSQGLDQGRLGAIEPAVAVLTNLSGDHFDYHGSREAYLGAKARLFEMLLPSGTAVLNADEPAAAELATRASARILSYGLRRSSEVRASGITQDGWRTRYRLRSRGREGLVRLALPGRFNVHNSLAAAAVGVAMGVDFGAIRRGLESVTQVPGRMERIEAGQPFEVVVDYAHNGYELSHALRFLRGITGGRVIVVFGCAGDRDPGRRPAMARAAAELADYVVVTSENTWREPAEQVVAELTDGLDRAGLRRGRDYTVRVDRQEAIELALSAAEIGDTVLVAGMGHEPTMVVAGEPRPWDDRAVIRELLSPAVPVSC